VTANALEETNSTVYGQKGRLASITYRKGFKGFLMYEMVPKKPTCSGNFLSGAKHSKGKVVPVSKLHTTKTIGEAEATVHKFLTSALDGVSGLRRLQICTEPQHKL